MKAEDIAKIEQKILNEIPILKSMQVQIKSLTEWQSIIKVPIEPNHNHKGTAFGGSLYSACTAASYTLLYGLQVQYQIKNREIVISKGEMKYFKPVEADFHVIAHVQPDDWRRCVSGIESKRNLRIPIQAFVRAANNQDNLSEFNGDFVFISI